MRWIGLVELGGRGKVLADGERLEYGELKVASGWRRGGDW